METIDNIVCEMREMERRTVGGIFPVNPRKLADRIEAAVKNHFRDVTKMETTTPRRNCDVYTMAEQSKRHEEYCKSHTTNGRCGKCPLWQMRLLGINCAVAWANFPYEKEGEA